MCSTQAYTALLGLLYHALVSVPLCLGFSPAVKNRMSLWLARAVLVLSWVAPVPAVKQFKPKNNLPLLDDYSVPAPAAFWQQFPVNKLTERPALIDHVKLRALAEKVGISGRSAEEVYAALEHGADIGCVGDCRAASRSGNSPSSFEYGRQVTDAVATWIKKGFVRGPVDLAAVPAQAKVNGIMCRPKPDGSVRVILNMSAPAGNSVNDGIDADMFPAVMSSTAKWLAVLYRAGRNCNIMKIDWADAYKHVPVRAADLPLEMRIPDPDNSVPVWAIDVFTDAAGGSADQPARGCGIVSGEHWAFVKWSKHINYGGTDDSGRKIGRKLSALELVGPLVAIAAGHSWCRNRQVRIWVDNIGSVQIWRKGYSTSCRLSTTLVKAISTVAASIGCRVHIRKIRRCSDTGAKMADALSKGDFKDFWRTADESGWSLFEEPMKIPGSILHWVADPKEDDDLGRKIVEELLPDGEFLGYNC